MAGRNPFDGKRRLRGGTRARLMLVPAVIFFLGGLGGGASGMLAGTAACLLIAAASVLTREGLRAQMAYEARAIARRPLPRKLAGAALTGLGIAVGALPGGGVVVPVLCGILGAGLHVATFGPDPLADKGEGMDAGRVARAVDEAEAYLAEIVALTAPLDDRALSRRIDSFAATARALFRRVEGDPRGLNGARRYLGVYLMGARDATARYADLRRQDADGTARRAYVALLSDLETDYASRTSALLQDDRADLELEIAVLRERLMRE